MRCPASSRASTWTRSARALIADMAVVDPTAGGNPVKLTKKGALALLENALAGNS